MTGVVCIGEANYSIVLPDAPTFPDDYLLLSMY